MIERKTDVPFPAKTVPTAKSESPAQPLEMQAKTDNPQLLSQMEFAPPSLPAPSTVRHTVCVENYSPRQKAPSALPASARQNAGWELKVNASAPAPREFSSGAIPTPRPDGPTP